MVLFIVIHIKDYINESSSVSDRDSIQPDLPEDNLLKFPEQNYLSREYIGKFVDQLLAMPEDPHKDIAGMQRNPIDPFEVVASKILSEKKW